MAKKVDKEKQDVGKVNQGVKPTQKESKLVKSQKIQSKPLTASSKKNKISI